MNIQEQQAQRRANQASKARRFTMLVFFVVGLLAAILAAGLFFWINAPQKTVSLRVGTGAIGTDTHVLVHEVNEVAARHQKPLSLEIVPTRDASQAVSLLNQGEIDLALIRANTPVVSDTRMIAELFADYFQLIVAGEKQVSDITEIGSVRLVLPPFGTDGFRAFWTLVDHYDLPIESLNWRAHPFPRATAMLLSGEADAIFTLRSLRDPTLLNFFEDARLKNKYLRYISLDQAVAMALKRPFLSGGVIPKGSFGGTGPLPNVDLHTVSVKRLLVTKENVDASAIRFLTEVLFEHRLDLTIRHPLSFAIKAPVIAEGLSIPLHQGAEDFYQRHEPSFVQENAEPLALGVTVLAMLISGLVALRSRLGAKQKNMADIYNYQLLDMNKRILVATNLEDVASIKAELAEILEAIVVALDRDEITDEGFQSFALICDQVQRSISDKRQDLLAARG